MKAPSGREYTLVGRFRTDNEYLFGYCDKIRYEDNGSCMYIYYDANGKFIKKSYDKSN